MKHSRVWLAVALTTIAQVAAAQARGAAPGRGGAAGGAPRDTTTGYAIKDRNVLTYCRRCHVTDSAGMITLNGVKLDPTVAKSIVRYLSDNHGIAPAELRPARFEVERRMVEFRYTADPRTENTCRACHSMGRVLTQRRTRSEWDLLVATHRGLFPDVDFQAFRRGGPSNPDSAPQPHPMDAAVTHLARAFPLRTPEWAAWSATMRPPHLEGTWLMSGMEPGRGAFFGHVTISKGPSDGEFVTQANYRYADGGPAVQRTGKSIVYTGYQWRG